MEIEQTLNSKVTQLESLLIALQKNNNQGNSVSQVASTDAMPTSCKDLRLFGHLWNGLYSVMGNDSVQTVFCDFTKLIDDPGTTVNFFLKTELFN